MPTEPGILTQPEQYDPNHYPLADLRSPLEKMIDRAILQADYLRQVREKAASQ